VSRYGPPADGFDRRIENGVIGISIWFGLLREAGSMMPKFVVPAGYCERSSTVTPIIRTAQQSCRGVSTIEDVIGTACVATHHGLVSPVAEW
jgi:hypothetical protein